MDGIATSPRTDRRDLFNETAARMGLSAVLVEKDFWVCWSLKRLFTLPGARPGMVFKGGTSLSKSFGLIRRFSEDVDLSLDRHALGFTGDRDPKAATTSKKRKTLLEDIGDKSRAFLAQDLVPRLMSDFRSVLGEERKAGWRLEVPPREVVPDQQTLTFTYPGSLDGGSYEAALYIKPTISLEFGARSEHWPSSDHAITPYAASEFPGEFKSPSCAIKTIEAVRTFWEKAVLMHGLYHRQAPNVDRKSRHYYDVGLLAKTDVRRQALGELDMLTKTAEHTAIFFPIAAAEYELARPGTLRLVPHDELRKTLEADYRSMKLMVFDEPPAFGDLLATLTELEAEVNRGKS